MYIINTIILNIIVIINFLKSWDIACYENNCMPRLLFRPYAFPIAPYPVGVRAYIFMLNLTLLHLYRIHLEWVIMFE